MVEHRSSTLTSFYVCKSICLQYVLYTHAIYILGLFNLCVCQCVTLFKYLRLSRRPEAGVGSPGAWVTGVVSCLMTWVLGTEPLGL